MSSLRGFLTFSAFICLLSLSKQHPVKAPALPNQVMLTPSAHAPRRFLGSRMLVQTWVSKTTRPHVSASLEPPLGAGQQLLLVRVPRGADCPSTRRLSRDTQMRQPLALSCSQDYSSSGRSQERGGRVQSPGTHLAAPEMTPREPWPCPRQASTRTL